MREAIQNAVGEVVAHLNREKSLVDDLIRALEEIADEADFDENTEGGMELGERLCSIHAIATSAIPVPCKKCGSIDSPLHTDELCPECHES